MAKRVTFMRGPESFIVLLRKLSAALCEATTAPARTPLTVLRNGRLPTKITTHFGMRFLFWSLLWQQDPS